MKTKVIYYDDFSGGLNDTANQRRIGRTEASLLRNWDITFQGSLKRRDGLTETGRMIPFETLTITESVTVQIS